MNTFFHCASSCHTCNPISQFLDFLVLLGFYAEVFIYTFTPTGASASFSGFQLWSLSHFELAFVQGKRCGADFILLQMAINLHQNHSLKRLDLLLLLLWVFFFTFFKCMFLMLFSIFTCLQLYGFISGFCRMWGWSVFLFNTTINLFLPLWMRNIVWNQVIRYRWLFFLLWVSLTMHGLLLP